ncbi:hypothetical protein ACFL1F_01190 [Chlamydiota bacterium]
MHNSMFNKQGKLNIPKTKSIKKVIVEEKELVEVEEAFCSKGHNLKSSENKFDGFPGIRMGFRKESGEEGEFVVSSILGKYEKKVVKGQIKKGEIIDLFCPICKTSFPVLSDCGGKKGSTIRLIFLTKKANINRSVSFCDCVGCSNSTLREAGEIIRSSQIKAL